MKLMKHSFKKRMEFNWINNGVKELYIATFLLESMSFNGQSNNLCFQSIEKIGKGLLFMTPAFCDNENLKPEAYPEFAKKLKKYSHNLIALVNKIDYLYKLDIMKSLQEKRAVIPSKKDFSFYDFLKLFSDREYLDSKYPTHNPTFKQFSIDENESCWDAIMDGSLPEELAYKIIRKFLKQVKSIDHVMIKNIFKFKNRPKNVGIKNWRRFRNLLWFSG